MSSSTQLNTESSKKVMYPLAASTSNAKSGSSSNSHISPPKAHHMPKSSNSLPKHHANQILPNIHSHINPHQYYSLRWNNYQK